ncbi:transcription initiation factor IIE subunit alpha, partial [Metarhizium majus ARSEF 297]
MTNFSLLANFFGKLILYIYPVIPDATHQRAAIIPIDGDPNRPMAVKGHTNTGPKSIAVNISSSDDTSVAEREAKKTRITHQNALPSWMSNSTVTGESFSGTSGAGISAANHGKVNKAAIPNTLADTNTSIEIDDYFEKLKAEQAAIMARRSMQNNEDEDFVSDEEDDNDEFEDVQAIRKNSNVGVSGNIVPKRKELGGMSWDDNFDERASSRLQKAKPDISGAKTTLHEGSDDDDEIEFEGI